MNIEKERKFLGFNLKKITELYHIIGYFGNTKPTLLKLHLLRYEKINEIKPVIENPTNIPKMKSKYDWKVLPEFLLKNLDNI